MFNLHPIAVPALIILSYFHYRRCFEQTRVKLIWTRPSLKCRRFRITWPMWKTLTDVGMFCWRKKTTCQRDWNNQLPRSSWFAKAFWPYQLLNPVLKSAFLESLSKGTVNCWFESSVEHGRVHFLFSRQKIIRARQPRYFGNVKGHNAILETLLEGKIERERTKDRQRRMVVDNIKRWTWTTLAECRKQN